MKNLTIYYLNELFDYQNGLLQNIESDLKNIECGGEWKKTTIKRKKELKLRIKELKSCIKFLNEL